MASCIVPIPVERRTLAALLLSCLFVALPAAAQERGFRLHRDDFSVVGASTFLVERPWYSALRFVAAGITLDYSHRPLGASFVLGRSEQYPIVEHALLGHVDLAGSLFDRVLLDATLPLTFLETGYEELVSQVRPLRGVSLGDPRVGARVRMFGQADRDPVSLHLGADLWIPIGAQARHQGDSGVRLQGRAVLAGAVFGAGRWTVDLGFHYRPYASFGPPLLRMTAASELRAGVALGVALFGERLHVGPEARLAMQVVGAQAFTREGTSLELLGGASLLLFDQVQVGVAAGGGLLGLAGTPDARLMLRLAWAPRRDADGDGVPNLDDDCPNAAGAANDARGKNGCPVIAPDADGDGVADVDDRCPFEPETVNGVRDGDGCPELALEQDSALAALLAPTKKPVALGTLTVEGAIRDAGTAPAQRVEPDERLALRGADGGQLTEEERARVRAEAFLKADSDGDGVSDDADRCPVTKEDLDGFEDEDGCPELDNDGDGVPDRDDRCPLESETVNGFEDEDGCPDVAPDADGDGVSDAQDRCPLEPESKDGVRDEDGCPESGSLEELSALAKLFGTALPSEQGPGAPRDADGDGVSDEADRCPVTKEDLDGFEDEDGCPELDNDGDGVADTKDKCPLDAEVLNGFKDDDGCPDEDADADRDGFAYDADRCPLEPGQAPDGCPHAPLPALALAGFPGAPASGAPEGAAATADLDKDGVPDEADACPVSPEDKDGFEDEDGCPELDNDKDGVLDKTDKCPFEAEVVNGLKDEDGCPDVGAGAVTVQGSAVLLNDVVRFKIGSANLQAVSLPLLKQVAGALKGAASISVEIQGHTDDVGSAAENIKLSKKRAEAIRAVLIKNGVAAQRLTAVGYGPRRPRASNKTPEGREQNRRVEFLILGEAK